MSVYLIGYDLNTPGKDYDPLIEAIKKIAHGWWHHLDSTWLIKHAGDADDILNTLKSHIDSNDEILVVKLTSDAAWKGFKESGTKWLEDNL